MDMKKIILDTDIGTDVKDALALALAIKSRKDMELRPRPLFMGMLI